MLNRTKLSMLLAMTIGLGMSAVSAASNQSPWEQPVATLAQQISDILGPGEVRLTVQNLSSVPSGEIPAIRKLLETDLKAHGVTASDAESASSLRVTLSESAGERLWVAEIVEGNRTQVAMVEMGPNPLAREQIAGGLMLRSQPVLSSREPVLAAMEVSDGLVVLEPEQIVFYTRANAGWQVLKRASIRQVGRLTRDPRGVVLAAPDGQNFEAWMSGTECTGQQPRPGDAAGDWTVECKPSDDPWPVVNASSLAEPTPQSAGAVASANELKAFYNGARDYFVGVVTPAVGVDLPPFYSAAAVPRPAGGAALLVGGIDGKVQLAENGALWTVAGTRDWGSDFAVLRSGCGFGAQIIASGSGEAVHDSLRGYELPALEAVPASAPLTMDGTVTALWSTPDGKSVFAVVQKSADQYEVDRVTALCD